jgi:hypothetical protein
MKGTLFVITILLTGRTIKFPILQIFDVGLKVGLGEGAATGVRLFAHLQKSKRKSEVRW